MAQPNLSSKPRISSTGMAAPPELQVRRQDASTESALSACSIALYMVGTPWKIVTWSRSMISSAVSGSKRGSIVTRAPVRTAQFIVQVWPKEWNSGSAPRRVSPGPKSPSVLEDQLLEVARLDEDTLGPGLGGALLGRIGEVVPGEQQLRAAVPDVELDLARLEQHVHRHHDAAGPQDRVVDRGEVGDVGEHQPDPVARLEPLRPEQRREARARPVEHRVAELDVVELEGRAVAVLGRRLGKDRGQVLAHRSAPLSLGAAYP